MLWVVGILYGVCWGGVSAFQLGWGPLHHGRGPTSTLKWRVPARFPPSLPSAGQTSLFSEDADSDKTTKASVEEAFNESTLPAGSGFYLAGMAVFALCALLSLLGDNLSDEVGELAEALPPVWLDAGAVVLLGVALGSQGGMSDEERVARMEAAAAAYEASEAGGGEGVLQGSKKQKKKRKDTGRKSEEEEKRQKSEGGLAGALRAGDFGKALAEAKEAAKDPTKFATSLENVLDDYNLGAVNEMSKAGAYRLNEALEKAGVLPEIQKQKLEIGQWDEATADLGKSENGTEEGGAAVLEVGGSIGGKGASSGAQKEDSVQSSKKNLSEETPSRGGQSLGSGGKQRSAKKGKRQKTVTEKGRRR